MVLIIGGAFQGQEAYAKEMFPDKRNIVSGESADREELESADMILGYHLFVKKMMLEGRDTVQQTRELIGKNPEVVLTMDELGCGIIPLEPFEREYRECAGRTGCLLAKEAEKVVRVYCGIPERIK